MPRQPRYPSSYLQYRGIASALVFGFFLLGIGQWLLSPPAHEVTHRPSSGHVPLPEVIANGRRDSAYRHRGVISGTARVVDGDTMVVDGRRIRMYGIDAPEQGALCHRKHVAWDCGRTATQRLSEAVAGRSVECEVQDTDRYGRDVAICWVGGLELNGMLVAEGLAVAYERYSARYVSAQMLAKDAGRGLWASGVSFTPPDEHRRSARAR